MPTAFSPDTKTYAVTITHSTSIAKLRTIADSLSRMDADTVALWSIAPFDVKNSPDWPEIESLFKGVGRKPAVVEVVTQGDVDAAAGKISVLS